MNNGQAHFVILSEAKDLRISSVICVPSVVK
jgi:hypothetical protein